MSTLDTHLVERQDLPVLTDPELPHPGLDALPCHVGIVSRTAFISESVIGGRFAVSFLFNISSLSCLADPLFVVITGDVALSEKLIVPFSSTDL